jgi:uncharacterized protein YyaL (SSP411 family)
MGGRKRRLEKKIKKPNRLAHEKSPYLLQHAYNPVDWYPWGPEAFEKARREDKPVLVSIGYSTCHWCHVMERECFENPTIAAVMNQHVVSIKVDREERPDVDKVYMTAVQVMTGAGGWPLNVFLDPDRKPFWGGTYFPPEDRGGRLGWPELIRRIANSWRDPEKRKEMTAQGVHLFQTIEKSMEAPAVAKAPGLDIARHALESFQSSYDSEHGGFSPAPKFPLPVNQHFLFRSGAHTMALETLRHMARGGIHDHLGGGFARYSTDERWHLPHFEKMLYDNAQLALNFLDAFQISRDPEFSQVAGNILHYVLRDMTDPKGGFYSAEDADSLPNPTALEKVEGAFYVWEKEEIEKILGPQDAALFNARYGVKSLGNVRQDPHGEFLGKNVLYKAQPLEEVGVQKSLEEARLNEARQKLLQARNQRPRPHLDDKVLTAWNGLMISALARGHQVLGDAAFLTAGTNAANFLRNHLYDGERKRLYRRFAQGERGIAALADDYAFLIQGLVDLYEASFDPQWLFWAEELSDTMILLFYDGKNGGFYMTTEGHDPLLPLRVRDDADNVEPSAASVATLAFLRLAQLLNRQDFRTVAEKTLTVYSHKMTEQPQSFSYMLSALLFSLEKHTQIVVAGSPADKSTQTLLKAIHSQFLAHKTLLLADGGANQKHLAQRLPFLENLTPKNPAVAYLCVDSVCQLPLSDPEELLCQLKKPR